MWHIKTWKEVISCVSLLYAVKRNNATEAYYVIDYIIKMYICRKWKFVKFFLFYLESESINISFNKFLSYGMQMLDLCNKLQHVSPHFMQSICWWSKPYIETHQRRKFETPWWIFSLYNIFLKEIFVSPQIYNMYIYILYEIRKTA